LSYCLATLQRRLLEWLADDAPHGDVTSELVVPRGLRAEAVVLAKSRGVAACTGELAEALASLGVEAEALAGDGSEVGPGDVVMRLRGDAQRILLVERTLLNLLIYLYGVAATTRLYVERARSVNPRIRVAATRKYPPGLGCLAKRAVRAAEAGADVIMFDNMRPGEIGEAIEALNGALRLSSRSSFQ